MRAAIAVFAKAPRPGHVKTRLAAHLGPERAAELHRMMVARLLTRLRDAADRLAVDVELHTDIHTDEWPLPGVSRCFQVSGDLGARMLHAIQTALSAGRPRILLVGGDVPTVPESHLAELLASDADVALGPAEDGGYYAISCRRAHPQMFAGVAWSTANACAQTAEACRAAGLAVAFGPQWFDIDEPSDLERI